MIVKLASDEMSLIRWACKLMEDIQDAGLSDNLDRDCTLELDGVQRAWLTVQLDKQEDSEILNEIMDNVNIRQTMIDLSRDLPKYTYCLDLGA